MDRKTLVGVYNKYLIDALLHAKSDDADGSLRRALRDAGHKAIAPDSVAYIEHAAASLRRDGLRQALAEQVDTLTCLSDARALAFEPLPGITVATLTGGHDADDGDIRTYVYILATLGATYDEVVDDDGDSPLVKSVIEVLSRAQQDDETGSSLIVDGIMEDDIAMLLERVAASAAAASMAAKSAAAATTAAEDDDDAAGQPFEGLMKSLKNSKIADMASEISKEIDLSGTENPMDLLNFEKLADSSSVLGNIVSKVGSKIQGKLASGELNHDELISEAVGFLKAFEGGAGGGGADGNPLSGLLAALGKGGGGGGGAGGGGGGMADILRMATAAASAAGVTGAAGGGTGNRGGRASFAERRDRMRSKLKSPK